MCPLEQFSSAGFELNSSRRSSFGRNCFLRGRIIRVVYDLDRLVCKPLKYFVKSVGTDVEAEKGIDDLVVSQPPAQLASLNQSIDCFLEVFHGSPFGATKGAEYSPLTPSVSPPDCKLPLDHHDGEARPSSEGSHESEQMCDKQKSVREN